MEAGEGLFKIVYENVKRGLTYKTGVERDGGSNPPGTSLEWLNVKDDPRLSDRD